MYTYVKDSCSPRYSRWQCSPGYSLSLLCHFRVGGLKSWTSMDEPDKLWAGLKLPQDKQSKAGESSVLPVTGGSQIINITYLQIEMLFPRPSLFHIDKTPRQKYSQSFWVIGFILLPRKKKIVFEVPCLKPSEKLSKVEGERALGRRG